YLAGKSHFLVEKHYIYAHVDKFYEKRFFGICADLRNYARLFVVMRGSVKLCSVICCYARICEIMLGYFLLCSVISYYARICEIMLGYLLLCADLRNHVNRIQKNCT